MQFDRVQFFDGGFGSLLQEKGLQPGELPQSWCLSHPEQVKQIHKDYLCAGADIITANTFGANALKFSDVAAVNAAAVSLAKQAAAECGHGRVALDLGPTGKLLQPYGTLDFEDAVSLYAEQVRAGGDADLILIETMTDLQETRAAVLAAKENSKLPVFVSFSLSENGRLLTGATIPAVVAVMEGMGVDAVGFNCGLGPRELLRFLPSLLECTSLPVSVCPNAGLPVVENGKTVYTVGAEEFADCMARLIGMGVGFAGGCCGTTPAHIRALTEKCKNMPFTVPGKKCLTVAAGTTQTVIIDKKPVIIGERINPTGKKRLKEAILSEDTDYAVQEAYAQQDAGADILDVNTGIPKTDESHTLPLFAQEVAQAVGMPLQIDTVDGIAMEKTLRRTCGKVLINSVNGSQASMDTVFPLAKKYGGVLVCLTLDGKSVPETARERADIAARIVKEAEKYGIERHNLLVDTLVMSVGTNADNAAVTLEAMRLVRKELGVKTVLGVSNVSFGLPDRPCLNAAFLTMALHDGLSAAIINPMSEPEMNAYRAFCVLNGTDRDAVCYTNAVQGQMQTVMPGKTPEPSLRDAVYKGLPERAGTLTGELLSRLSAMDVIQNEIIPALTDVGTGYEQKKLFLPQLLSSAKAAQEAFAVIARCNDAAVPEGEPVVIATVQGDIHDIGKNIVAMLLRNYGFRVIDLGKDVPAEAVLEAARKENAKLVGLSALMTTTVPAMEKTVLLLHENMPECRVMVGGAVLTQSYAQAIGADYYAADAMAAVQYAKKLGIKIFQRGDSC